MSDHPYVPPRPNRRVLLLPTGVLGAFFAVFVAIVHNWKVAENPPCLTFLDERERMALAGAPLGAPEVHATQASCFADWGAVQVQMRRLGRDDDDYDRRAETWRGEPGFVALRLVEDLGAPARLGVIDRVVMGGGHARAVRLVVERPAGWLEVAVQHHWPAEATAPATEQIEARLVDGVRRHLAASDAFYLER
jgi:hypothetical protein